jgi:hypothetical protein
MTALVLENRGSTRPNGLGGLPTRVARVLDDLVSARAARSLHEWQMREVQAQIDRYVSLMGTSELQGEKSRPASHKISPSG